MVGAYDEYGNQSNSAIGRFQYTGQTWLPEVGLYYYKARLHSPNLGRFMQTDPIGYKDGMNWYAYVGNDPVNAVDSTGMCSSENSNSYLACSLEDKLTNLLTPLIQKALESSGGEVVDDDSSEYEHEPPDNSVLEETVAIVENGVKARNPMKDVKRIIKVHGGGKNDKHANQARREAARLKYEQARAKVAELKARPNKTKQDKEDLKKAENEMERARRQKDFTGENHSQKPKR